MKRRDKFLAVALLSFAGLSVYLYAGTTSTGVSVPRTFSTNNPPIFFFVNRVQVNDSTGTVTLVTGTSGTKIQVWGCTLATAASTMEFKSSNTSLTGPMSINAIQIDPVGGNAAPWLETKNTGDDLVLVLGSAAQVSGQVIYTQSP